MPEKDKMNAALQWLCDNPIEASTTTAYLYYIEYKDSVCKAWLRLRKRDVLPVDQQKKREHRPKIL